MVVALRRACPSAADMSPAQPVAPVSRRAVAAVLTRRAVVALLERDAAAARVEPPPEPHAQRPQSQPLVRLRAAWEAALALLVVLPARSQLRPLELRLGALLAA